MIKYRAGKDMEMRSRMCITAMVLLATGLPAAAAEFLSNGAPCDFPMKHKVGLGIHWVDEGAVDGNG